MNSNLSGIAERRAMESNSIKYKWGEIALVVILTEISTKTTSVRLALILSSRLSLSSFQKPFPVTIHTMFTYPSYMASPL